MKYYVYDFRICNVVAKFDTWIERQRWLGAHLDEMANFELYQI